MRLPSYQDLSREQDKINNLPLDKSYLVTGPPGTGKTVMALYRAAMLAKQGIPTSLLMHSRLLSQYMHNAVEDLQIDGTARTFHSWTTAFYRARYRTLPPSLKRYKYDWDAILTTLAANPPDAGELEHLIVDEGQDLPRQFYPVARHLAKCITVFADENQRITEDQSTINDITAYGVFKAFHELRRNYRNTQEIAKLAAHFYCGLPTGIPDLPTRRGALPVVRACASLREAASFIGKYEWNNSHQQIGVLVQAATTRDALFDLLDARTKTKHPIQRYRGGMGAKAARIAFDTPGVVVLCYNSAKGLEFDTVILPEMQENHEEWQEPGVKMKLYVVTSRARDQLYMLYSGGIPPAVVADIPDDLYTRET